MKPSPSAPPVATNELVTTGHVTPLTHSTDERVVPEVHPPSVVAKVRDSVVGW